MSRHQSDLVFHISVFPMDETLNMKIYEEFGMRFVIALLFDSMKKANLTELTENQKPQIILITVRGTTFSIQVTKAVFISMPE